MESVPTLLSLTVKMRRGKDRKSVDALHGNNGTCPALHTGLPFIVNVLLSPLGGLCGLPASIQLTRWRGKNGTCPALQKYLPVIVNVLLPPLGGDVGSQLLHICT